MSGEMGITYRITARITLAAALQSAAALISHTVMSLRVQVRARPEVTLKAMPAALVTPGGLAASPMYPRLRRGFPLVI